MTLVVRPAEPNDLIAVHALYSAQIADIPLEFAVSEVQFRRDVATCRLYPEKDWFNPAAEIALVAENDGQIVAYGNGGQILTGDFLMPDRTAFIRFMVGHRDYHNAANLIIQGITQHLLSFQPVQLLAFSPFLTPPFLGRLTGAMPSTWNWLGQRLQQQGYQTGTVMHLFGRMLINDPPQPMQLPNGLSIRQDKTYVNGVLIGHDYAYNVGFRLLKGVEQIGWCGNFYAGAFIDEAEQEQIFTYWFNIQPEYRGHGYGRLLLRHMLVEASQAGATHAVLLSDTENFVAEGMYYAEGYRPLDTVSDFKYVGFNFLEAITHNQFELVRSFFNADGTLKPIASYRPYEEEPSLTQDVDVLLAQGLLNATQNNHLDIVAFLLEQGVNVNIYIDGATVLHRAAYNGLTEMVYFLLEHGADPKLLDVNFNEAPATWAGHAGYHQLAAYLNELA